MTVALQYLPVARWNALAYLSRKGGEENAAMLRTRCQLSVADLIDLVDAELATAHRGDGEAQLHARAFLPLIQIRLTPRGRAFGDRIVRIAGALLWLHRKGRSGVGLRQLMQTADLGLDDVRELEGLRFVEVFPADGSVRPFTCADITNTADVRVRATPTGARYTTERSKP